MVFGAQVIENNKVLAFWKVREVKASKPAKRDSNRLVLIAMAALIALAILAPVAVLAG